MIRLGLRQYLNSGLVAGLSDVWSPHPTPPQALLGSWGPRENVPFLSPRQHGRTVLVNPAQEEEPGSSRPSCLAPWGPGATAERQKASHPLPGGPADSREFQPSRCLEGL